MKSRFTISAVILVLLIVVSVILSWAGVHFFQLHYRIIAIIARMSLIVLITLLAVFVAGHHDKLGYVFLGTVIFKMFGIGYLTVFQTDFEENVIAYFVIFWLMLAFETLALIYLLKFQDNYHKNKLK